MAKIDLFNLKEDDFQSGLEGKKIIVYGVNDTGKTKQLTKLPKPLLLMTESGGSAVKCKKVPIDSWDRFKEVVNSLTKSSQFDDLYKLYNTIIIDTAENLVNLSEQAICDEFEVRDLSEIDGRKNGYKIARNDFNMFINKLTGRGYTVVFIAHEETITKTDEVTGEEYIFVQPKGSSNEKSSMRMLRDLCDFCIYLQPQGIDKETYETIPSIGICKRTKNVFARSRFAIQTFIRPFTSDGLITAIEEAVKKSAEEENADIVAYEQKSEAYTKEDYFDLIKPYVEKLSKIDSDFVIATVENELGESRKITSATDDELKKLSIIYNNLVTKATLIGIEV